MIISKFQKKLFNDVFILGSYKYIAVIIQFISSIIIARLLMPEEIGVVALVSVFTGFLMLFSENGISYIIIRSSHKLTFHNTISALTNRVGVVLFSIFVLSSYPIALFYKDTRLIAISLLLSTIFILQSLSVVGNALLIKNKQYKILGKISLIVIVTQSLLIIILAIFNFSYWSIVLSSIVSKGIETILIIKYSQFKPFWGKPYHWIAGWRESKVLILNLAGFSLLNYWARNLDNLLIGRYYGPKELGIYSKGYSLLTMPLGMLLDVFNKTLFPLLQEDKNNNLNHRDSFISGLDLVAILAFPLMIVYIFLPHYFINLIWGAGWLKVAEILPYFGLLIFIQSLVGMSGNLILLEKHDSKIFYNGISVLFSVVGIIYGSLISVVGVAKYYSLFNIVGTISFGTYYAYCRILKFPITFLLNYWLPKIILCMLLWAGITMNCFLCKVLGASLLFFHLLFNLTLKYISFNKAE